MAAAPGHSAPPPTCTSLTEGPAAPGTVSARVPARGRGPRASFPLPVARPALPATPLRRQCVASGVDFCAAGHRRHFPTGEPARSARQGAHLGLWLQLRATSRPRSQIGSLALTSVSTADEGACLHPDAHRSLRQHCPDRALSDLGGARSSGTPARRHLPRVRPSQRLAVVLAPSLRPSHLLPPAPVTCAVSYVRAAALLSCLLPLPGLDFADTRRPWTSHRPPGVVSRFPSLLQGHRGSPRDAGSVRTAGQRLRRPRPECLLGARSAPRVAPAADSRDSAGPKPPSPPPWPFGTLQLRPQNHAYSESNIYIVLRDSLGTHIHSFV